MICSEIDLIYGQMDPTQTSIVHHQRNTHPRLFTHLLFPPHTPLTHPNAPRSTPTATPDATGSLPTLVGIHRLLRVLRNSITALEKIERGLSIDYPTNGFIYEDIVEDRKSEHRGDLTENQEKQLREKEEIELDAWRKEKERLGKLIIGIEEDKQQIMKTIEEYDRLAENMEKVVV